jgi:hypothetical protein
MHQAPLHVRAWMRNEPCWHARADCQAVA